MIFSREFFYSGFRYALIEGIDAVDPKRFCGGGCIQRDGIYGGISFSNPMIEQFLKNTRWSQKSNFVDIPTDCPQREKSGWTGDAQVFADTASYLADTASVLSKMAPGCAGLSERGRACG